MHSIYVYHANAEGMTSVMLMDCDHTVQQNVEFGNDRIGRCLGYMHAEVDPDRSSLSSRILLKKSSQIWKNVEFCISAATISETMQATH